jgi:hypothetical protein
MAVRGALIARTGIVVEGGKQKEAVVRIRHRAREKTGSLTLQKWKGIVEI